MIDFLQMAMNRRNLLGSGALAAGAMMLPGRLNAATAPTSGFTHSVASGEPYLLEYRLLRFDKDMSATATPRPPGGV